MVVWRRCRRFLLGHCRCRLGRCRCRLCHRSSCRCLPTQLPIMTTAHPVAQGRPHEGSVHAKVQFAATQPCHGAFHAVTAASSHHSGRLPRYATHARTHARTGGRSGSSAADGDAGRRVVIGRARARHQVPTRRVRRLGVGPDGKTRVIGWRVQQSTRRPGAYSPQVGQPARGWQVPGCTCSACLSPRKQPCLRART